MDKKRIIVFKNDESKRNGFKILRTVREPFSSRDGGKYIISKKQCAILKAQHVEYTIKKYL